MNKQNVVTGSGHVTQVLHNQIFFLTCLNAVMFLLVRPSVFYFSLLKVGTIDSEMDRTKSLLRTIACKLVGRLRLYLT